MKPNMMRELGIFERSQLIADSYSTFHIVGALRLENAPPPHIVRKSLGILQGRHPFLSVRLLPENGKNYFAALIDPPLPFRNLPRWNDEHWTQVVETELATRIDSLTGPLFRCAYLHSESHPHAEVLLTLSHLIADAASASQLLHELLTICASLMDRMPVSVSKLPPAPTVESRFPTEFRGLKMSQHILKYALAQMEDEISYRIQTRGKRTPQVPTKSTQGHILSLQFSEDEIEPFAQRARKEGVTLNSALNAALLLSVNRHLYAGKNLCMRTFSFADLRPYVHPPLPPEDLGLYISMMRYSALVEGSMDFWSLARDLHKKIYSSLKSGNKFVAAVMAESLMKMITRLQTIRLAASALNYSGVVSIQANYGSIKVLEVHGFVSGYGIGPELASQAQFFDNQLFWDFIYLEEDMSRDTAIKILDEIQGIIQSAVK